MSNEHRADENAAHGRATIAEIAGSAFDASSRRDELLEIAFRQAYDAVVITTPDLNPPGPTIVYVNAAFTRMTGYGAAEVIGKTPRILQGPRTQRQVLDELRGRLSQGLAFEGQAINYRKDGSEFWLEWRIAPVRDAEGRVIYWISLQHDVTDRKRLEAERHRFTEELERRVDERTERLAAANAENERLLRRESSARARAEQAHGQLEADDRVKDEFLALLAHELRNPMASIAMAAQLLALEPVTPSAIARARAVIERQMAHLSRRLDDLLDITRLTAERVNVREQPQNLGSGASEGARTSERLPQSRSAKPRPPPPAAPSAATGRLRVLVVDDNDDVREALVMLLSARGHDVRAEADGPQALRAAEQFPADVVLLDIGLPGMDGYEVARRIRAGNEQVRLVALTGYGREQDQALSRAAGFDAHLVKPVALNVLDRELSRASHQPHA